MSNPNQPPQPPPIGRSRGRARVAAGPTPVPQQPAPIQPGSQITPRPPPQSDIPAAEPGRGRGLQAESTQSSSSTPSSGSGVGTAQKPSVSPKSGSSEDSPPQQHSPPEAKQSGAGRAALRGQPHQPSINQRVAAGLPNIDRLAIGSAGVEPQPQQQPTVSRIDAVPFMKPSSCLEKKGETGTPVQIFCNYFEVVSQPDWILYQYHVDFAPLVDSKRTRMLLMKPHDHLFRNKAFDGSTVYSLTKLELEVREICVCGLLS